MIRIDLVDNTNRVKHIDFRVIPVTTETDFTCNPPGIMPLRVVMRLSQKVQAGHVYGTMGKYLWYRLTETPAADHKNPMIDPQSSTMLHPRQLPDEVLDRRQAKTSIAVPRKQRSPLK